MFRSSYQTTPANMLAQSGAVVVRSSFLSQIAYYTPITSSSAHFIEYLKDDAQTKAMSFTFP